jgi:energy-coupling factor transport system ATP-binding protein
VSFRYPGSPVQAVHAVSFELGAGEVAALVGPSGAGKSTLARLALGLLEPASGSIELAGYRTDRTRFSVLASLGGLVLQNPLQQLLTEHVEDELLLGLRAMPSHAAMGRMGEFLRAFGLEDVRRRHPLTLSEGQRRRVALAAVLARRPRVVILDEPTLGQDERQRSALVDLIRALAAEGRSVLAITHDREFVNDVADRVLVLRGGQLVADLDAIDTVGLQRAGVPLADIPAAALQLGIPARSVADLVWPGQPT